MSSTVEYQSDFARRYFSEGRTEGRTEGKVEALLAVLDARGIDVPAAERSRIAECTDVNQLDAWVRRAVSVESVQDLFA